MAEEQSTMAERTATLADAMQLAASHVQAERLAEAESVYRAILAAIPQEPESSHQLGQLLARQGRFDEQITNNRGQTTVSHSKQTLSFERGVGFFSFFRSANELRIDHRRIIGDRPRFIWVLILARVQAKTLGDRPRFPCKPCPSHEGWGFFHKGLGKVQGLYGRNDKGVIAIAKPDPALVAVLINREHSRLSSQVKTLEKVLHAPFSDKEHQRLTQLAANWRALLAFDDGAPEKRNRGQTTVYWW